MRSFVTHLECSETGERVPSGTVAGLSKAGKPLLVRYDLQALGRALKREMLQAREADMWRYGEFLPLEGPIGEMSLGESMTPLAQAPETARAAGGRKLTIKDEGRLPTGSFKARGLCVAVAMAKRLGIQRIAMPTAGNAGAALAAYCARAQIEAFIFCPDDTPEATISEIALHGGKVYRVNGNITELGPLVEAGAKQTGWFNLSTLKEPYRLEGKKTMGFEIAEQLGWKLPDVIFYPTGGGTGLIGMWKAFAELEAVGWIGPHRPRMVAVQSATCAPLVRAFERKQERAEVVRDGHTNVPGLRVPWTIGDALILKVLRESKGFAISVGDDEVEPERLEVARRDGIHLCPETAATAAAYRKAIARGLVGKDEHVLLINTATGLKAPLPQVTARLDRMAPISYATLSHYKFP